MTTSKRPPAAVGGGRSRTPLIIAVGFAVVILAGLIAVVATREDEGSADRAAANVFESRTVEVTGTPLPPLSQDPAAADPAVGQVAPELRGASFDGTRVNILRDGRPKVVLFVAHWCPHCQVEVPLVTQYLSENPQTALDVYAVSTGVNKNADNYPPSAWLEEERWPAPVVADSQDGAAAAAWGLSAYPYFVTLDKDGKVLARRTGELPATEIDALFKAAAATAG